MQNPAPADKNGNGVPDVCEPQSNPYDLDGDGTVGGGDLSILLNAWGQAGGIADVDGSGTVDAADLTIILNNWG